ncbi:hypothetical protein [Staphylococcus pseudintermedius]|uniref:hypothetical protein n=1 Tax=Staphylococcus pseudintermedius TaxID=283734 RepID=UPI0035C23252
MSNFTFPDPFKKSMENFRRMDRVVSRTLRPQINLAYKYNSIFSPELINSLQMSLQIQKQLNLSSESRQRLLETSQKIQTQFSKPMAEISATLMKFQAQQARIISQQFKPPVINIFSSNKILSEIEQDESIVEEAVSSMEKLGQQDFYMQQSLFTFELLDQMLNTLNTKKVQYPLLTYTVGSLNDFISDFYTQVIYDYLFSEIFGSLPTNLIDQLPLYFISLFIGIIIIIACQKMSK